MPWPTLQARRGEERTSTPSPHCLKLAKEAGAAAGTYPTVMAAADEIAVEAFLQERIAFTDIPDRRYSTTKKTLISLRVP